MALAQNHGNQLVAVAADVFHFLQCRAGRHEAERAAVDALQRLTAQGQTETVHRYHRQALIADLKQRTRMDRAAFVGGHGKAGLVNHGLERILGDGHGILVVHLRKLRIVLSAQTHDVKAGVTAGQMDRVLFIGVEHDDVIGHLADDLAEEPGIDYNAAGFVDLRLKRGADTGLHIEAGQGQTLVTLQQDTLQRGNGAFGGHGAGGGGNGILQQSLLTRKSQHIDLIPFLKLHEYFRKTKHKLIFF